MKKRKIKTSNPLESVLQILKNSISRALFITIITVTLIPLAFLFISLDTNSWDSVYKEELAKHKLLATSLVTPIQLKINSYQHKLKLLDISLQSSSLGNHQEIQASVNKFTNNFDNAIAVSLLLTGDKLPIIGLNKSILDQLEIKPNTTDYIDQAEKYQQYEKKNTISPVFKSSLSNKSVIVITHPIIDKNDSKIGTLFAEIEPNFIKDICANISFGTNGHCAVVDNKNRIIAHSNISWIATRHNLTNHKLIQELRKNNSGSLIYTSKTSQQEMLGAYAKIKDLGWGILITRPKYEIDSPLNSALQNILIWGVAGLLLALTFVMLIMYRLTKPLNILNERAEDIKRNPKECKLLKEAPKNSSNEVKNIWNSFANILTLYHDSIDENNSLNVSSKKDIHQVMSKMRQQNTKKPINIDPITGLTNDTFFVEELRKSLLIYRGDIAGLILIEINNYKLLISKGNEELANTIIKHVAKLLIASTRDDDIVSHYGNAGRFAIFINNCSTKSIQGTAKKLRSLIEVNPIEWKGNTVYIEQSIGIVVHKITKTTTVNTLMAYSEQALIKSISAGENKISTYQHKQIETA